MKRRESSPTDTRIGVRITKEMYEYIRKKAFENDTSTTVEVQDCILRSMKADGYEVEEEE